MQQSQSVTIIRVLNCLFLPMASKSLARNPHLSPILIVALLTLLTAAAPMSAQRVVTQDAGGGRKIELHYNAANQVTETRTIGADGKLLEKDTLEYPQGALVPQSVATAYWPNGQAQKITRNTYDDNSNFTGEFIQVFDESGKQTGGHRLTHDPQTNIYHCEQWDVATQNYKVVECPAGEESSGPPETVKKFTAEEVHQQLMKARQSSQRARPAPAAAKPSAGPNVKEVGLVLPAQMRAGERVSGSVVEDPGAYEDMPELVVTRFAIPFPASGAAANLSGWRVEIPGEQPQAADGPITLSAPRGATLSVLFRQADGVGAPLAKTMTLPATGRNRGSKGKGSASFMAPAVCLKGQLCTVSGPFSGDSSKTFAAFEARPAKVLAETPETAYLAIPDATEPGSRPLAIAEGDKAIAFPMVVAAFTIRPPRRDLPKGEVLLMYPTVEGAGEIPEALWRPGNYPASNLERARKLVPGFQPPAAGKQDHEAEERREREEKRKAAGKRGENEKMSAPPNADKASGKNQDASQHENASDAENEENEGGEILLVVKNLTPEVANFRDSKDGMYVFHLHAPSFKMGDFIYKFVVEAKQTGNFGVQGYVIPFLAPVEGQIFPIASGAASLVKK